MMESLRDSLPACCSLKPTAGLHPTILKGFSHSAQPVRRYIAGQEDHHRSVTFQAEFRRLLKRYQIEYNERYVLGLNGCGGAVGDTTLSADAPG
jgi:hypothetical protein